MEKGVGLNSGISVIIPCLNEAHTIQMAVREAYSALKSVSDLGEVIVADNGSVDNSAQLAADAGARVVSIPNLGYGAVLDGGIRSARFSKIVFADADLSYQFSELEKIIRPLQEGSADLVVGTRLKGKILPGAMPFLNRFLGTPILSWMIRFLYSLPTTDCNSGYRAFSLEKYLDLGITSQGMEFASEMLIRAARNNLRYHEVPITFHRDQRNRSPHLRRWRDGWRHFKVILSLISLRKLTA
jgi:glycosyltransferase involved in cell wall biosynthesis